jgi:hypothetical protein
MQLPTIEFPEVYHVGELDAQEMSNLSFEGNMLSVSMHPQAWTKIMRKYNKTSHVFSKSKDRESHLKFALIHEIISNKDYLLLKNNLTRQAVEMNLITKAACYHYRICDDNDNEIIMTAKTIEEALEETSLISVENIDKEHPEIWEGFIYKGTEQFLSEQKRVSSDWDLLDIGIAEVIRQKYPEIDGVWWDETLDVLSLSAPRGGLFYGSRSFYIEKRLTATISDPEEED